MLDGCYSSPIAAPEAFDRVGELTGGDSARAVLDCVGTVQVVETAFGVVREAAGSAGQGFRNAPMGRWADGPIGYDRLMPNVTRTGGATPAVPGAPDA